MTNSHLMRDSPVMMSSTMPSAKYSCSGSPLMFWNGSTATDDILELVLAHVSDVEGQLPLDLLIGTVRKADRARLGQRLDPGSDIDSIAVNVAFVGDNVADVDADTKGDLPVFGNVDVALGHRALDFHGATHGIDRACKFDQCPVARGLDDTAAMFGDFGIDKFAPARLERSKSAFFVDAHQPAVAGDIGCEDGSQPPVDPRLGHGDRPYAPRFPTEFMASSRGCLSRGNHVRSGH